MTAGMWTLNPMSLINLYHLQHTSGPQGKWLFSLGRQYTTLSGWDTQNINDLCRGWWKLLRENPRAVFYSYNKGDIWGLIFSLTLSSRCSPLRYNENTDIHREITTCTLTDSMNTKYTWAHPTLGAVSHKEATLNQKDLSPAYYQVNRGIQKVSEAIIRETNRRLGLRRMGRAFFFNVGGQGGSLNWAIWDERDSWTEQWGRRKGEPCKHRNYSDQEHRGPEAREILWHLSTVTVSKQSIWNHTAKAQSFRESWTGKIFKPLFPQSQLLNRWPQSSGCDHFSTLGHTADWAIREHCWRPLLLSVRRWQLPEGHSREDL